MNTDQFGFRNLTLALCLAIGLGACGGGGGSSVETSTPPPVVPPPVTTPLRSGAYVGNPVLGSIVVGREFKTTLSVVANDKNNEIVQLEVGNPTSSGAVPIIDIAGNIRWTPNQADFDGAMPLKLKIILKQGDPTEQDLPVTLVNEIIALQSELSSENASYSDADGRYLVKASRQNNSSKILGNILITEKYDKGNLVAWQVNGRGTKGTVRLDVLNSPNILAAPAPARMKPLSISSDDYPLTSLPITGKEFKGAGLTRDGSIINYGTDIISSRYQGVYSLTVDDDPVVFNSTGREVFDFVSSCSGDFGVCREKAKTKSPIILIHGFSGTDSSAINSSAQGGGKATWGNFPKELIAKGHPVFEMQWHSYMRFEEAAGALAKYSEIVSKITLKKPIVVAHSFGGIVSHLALESRGITFKLGSWQEVSYKNQISKLITLNSPLGGVSHPAGGLDRSEFKPDRVDASGNSFRLVRGRDHTDKMIGVCYAITCMQAGALFNDSNNNGLYLKASAALIAGDSNVRLTFKSGSKPESIEVNEIKNLVYEGSSVKNLKNSLATISTPVLSFVGFQDLGITDANALLGDGLISLIGMAVDPLDFSTSPYASDSKIGYEFVSKLEHTLFKVGANAEKKSFDKLLAGECFSWEGIASSRKYIVCARSAHTGGPAGKRIGGTDFSIANLGDEDMLKDSPTVIHPLFTLMDDPNWVSAPPQDAPYFEDLLEQAPISVFSWRAYREVGTDKDYSYILPGFINIIEKASGKIVLSTSVFGDPTSKFYIFNLGQELTREVGAIPDLNKYSMTLKMGGYLFGSLNYGSSHLEAVELAGIKRFDPDIDLTKREFVSVSGRIVDSTSSSTPLAGVTIYMAKGDNWSSGYLRNLPNQATTTTRVIYGGSSGEFTAAGIEPGRYSALLSKLGYEDRLIGELTLSAGVPLILSFSPNTTAPAPDQSVILTSVQDDAVTPPVQLVRGALTTDNSPLISGSLSAALRPGESVVLYDGTVLMGSAAVDGKQWIFSTLSALALGPHELAARVQNSKGQAGPLSGSWGIAVVPKANAYTFSDEFNDSASALDASKWTSRPMTAGFGDPAVANGLAHIAGCQAADTAGKIAFTGGKIVIEARFAGQKASGRDSNISLIDPATGLSLQIGDTSYQGWGIYAQLNKKTGNEYNKYFGGTSNLFKEYRITLDGVNVTIERGATLANLTERYVLVMPRSVTDGKYHLRIGTGGCDGVYSPADFDWIRVAAKLAEPSDNVPAPSWSLNFSPAEVTAAGGSAIGSPTYITGKDNGAAVSFAGGAKLKIPNRAEMKVGSGATFDVWVKPIATGNGTVIAKSHDARGAALMIAGTAASVTQAHVATFDPTWRCTTSSTGSAHIEKLEPIAYGSWIRLTVVIDPNNGYRAYLNKKLSQWCSGIKPSILVMDAQDSYIGGFSDSWWPLTGAVQDLKIYNSALTESQVQALP